MTDKELTYLKSYDENIQKKLKTWELTRISYSGDQELYRNGGYLTKYSRESDITYAARLKSAIYFAHLAPIIDVLVGFISETPPKRDLPSQLKEFLANTSRGKDIDNFLHRVATQGLLYTVGILIDNKVIDNDMSEAERKALGIHPYAVLYYPWEIRKFCVADNGEIEWILLDNSYDKKTVYGCEHITVYRLWTKDYYKDYKWYKDGNEDVFSEGEEIQHNIGAVPFVFLNSRDVDDDYLSESIGESIAYIDNKFYNKFSEFEEAQKSGTFRVFIYPEGPNSKLETSQALIEFGVSDVEAITYDGGTGQAPGFIGGAVESVILQSYMDTLQYLLKEMFQRVGLDKDSEKNYAQSGAAKRWEFRKTEGILKSYAQQLEAMEIAIYNIVARYYGIQNPIITVKYNKQFVSTDVDERLKSLYDALSSNIKSSTYNKEIQKRIVANTLENISQDKLQLIYKEIESEKEEKETL